MVKKLNILFDATILLNAVSNNSARSGIFFTAYNVLKNFATRDDCKVILYCENGSSNVLAKFCKFKLKEFSHLPILNDDGFILKHYGEAKFNKKLAKTEHHKFMAKTYHFQKFFWGLFRPFVKLKKMDLRGIDCFFSPCFKIPEEIAKNEQIRKYVVIYDAIPLLFPEYFPSVRSGNYWLSLLIESMNSKDHYFAISQATKDDFLQFAKNTTDNQITVTPLAASDNFYHCSEKTVKSLEKYHLPTDKKYIFSLCSLEPRKNLIRAVTTFLQFIKKHNIDDMVFILGGGAWDGFVARLEKEVPNYDKTKIIRAGYLDDDDLAPLYSGAEWFVYTSQYEGFGLPPLEAMACGCSVITSNNSSLPEVVGDAGIMIDWDSDEQHIAAYEKYYFDDRLRKENAKKGIARAKEFSWVRTVDLMIKEMKRGRNEELSCI